jgi:hypothetical protein
MAALMTQSKDCGYHGRIWRKPKFTPTTFTAQPLSGKIRSLIFGSRSLYGCAHDAI